MRFVTLVGAMLFSVAFGMCLMVPRSPRAADVERVQRACAEIAKEYPRDLFGTPDSSKWADEAFVHGWPAKRFMHARVGIPVMDARVYELFCK